MGEKELEAPQPHNENESVAHAIRILATRLESEVDEAGDKYALAIRARMSAAALSRSGGIAQETIPLRADGTFDSENVKEQRLPGRRQVPYSALPVLHFRYKGDFIPDKGITPRGARRLAADITRAYPVIVFDFPETEDPKEFRYRIRFDQSKTTRSDPTEKRHVK